MAVKKLNLSSEVKSRLRRAVLGGLDASAPIKTAASAKKSLLLDYQPKKSLMAQKSLSAGMGNTLKIKNMATVKSSVKAPPKSAPIKSKPSVKAVAKKPSKPKIKILKSTGALKSAPKGKTAEIKAPIKPFVDAGKPAIAGIKPSYRPFASSAKRNWEMPRKEESLEKLFSKPAKSKFSGKFDSFSKTSRKAGKPLGNFWLRIIGMAAILIVLVAAYWPLGIYQFGFTDPVSEAIAKTLSLPAGYVGGQAIGVGEYIDDYRLLSGPLSQKREGLIDYTSKTELSDRIFFRLAANKLVEEKLKEYGQAVTPEDIDNQLSMLIRQAGSQAEAEKMIDNLYGLKFEQFKSLVLLPMMARANLQAAIVADDKLPITAAAKLRAEEVLGLATVSSTDFSALAKQYTDDEAGVNTGGDLGWVVKGQLDADWENLIFSAATGTVIAMPIRSGFGFHVVKAEQKLIDKKTGALSVKLRHILIKVDVDQYIKELLDSVKTIKYIK